MKPNRGLLVVLSGPSGSGKGTVLKQAMRSNPNIEVSVSVTTRAPREGEIDGVNYYFLTPEAFQNLLAEDGLLEWAEFCGNFYGTPREKIEQRLNEGKDVVLEIEVQGAMKVRAAFPDAVLIFNLPPSLEELKNRLTGRKTEPPEVVEKRLNTAVWEISQAENYGYVIVNDDVENAVGAFLSILESEKCKLERNKALLAQF